MATVADPDGPLALKEPACAGVTEKGTTGLRRAKGDGKQTLALAITLATLGLACGGWEWLSTNPRFGINVNRPRFRD